jgi:hypothetical protein
VLCALSYKPHPQAQLSALGARSYFVYSPRVPFYIP